MQNNMGKWITRYLVFVTGLYFITLGVVFIIRSSLGTSPISSFNYVISENSSMTLGTVTFFFNVALILAQLWFIRGIGSRRDRTEILMQIPFSLIFSAFLDFNMYLAREVAPVGHVTAYGLLLLGCIIQAVGVVLEVKPNVVTMSAEGFVKYASRRYHKDFGKFKMGFDVSLVVLAAVSSLLISKTVIGIGTGTVIAAFLVGYLVNVITNRMIPKFHR